MLVSPVVIYRLAQCESLQLLSTDWSMRVSAVVIYRLAQRYAHVTVQKHFYSQATFRHASVPPTTTIRADSST